MENPRSRYAAQWRPPTWQSLVAPLALVLTFVVAVVFLLSTAVNFFLLSREPQAAVDEYLTLLEGGSSRQVLAPLGVAGIDSSVQILPNPVYRNAANRPVEHRLVSVQEHGAEATVVMDVRTGDQKVHRLDYVVERRVSTGLLNDTWQLRRPDAVTVSVDMPAALDALSVNGRTVQLEDAAVRPGRSPLARTWQFEGLPGVYQVGLPSNSNLMATENSSQGISIEVPRPVSLKLEVKPSPRMWEQVDRAIQDAIRKCETGAGLDGNCPPPRAWAERATTTSDRSLQGNVPSGVSQVRWHLESRPAVVLESDGEDPVRYRVQRYRPAVATVTYVRGGKTFTEKVKFGVDATARSTGSSVETNVRLQQSLTTVERDYQGS